MAIFVVKHSQWLGIPFVTRHFLQLSPLQYIWATKQFSPCLSNILGDISASCSIILLYLVFRLNAIFNKVNPCGNCSQRLHVVDFTDDFSNYDLFLLDWLLKHLLYDLVDIPFTDYEWSPPHPFWCSQLTRNLGKFVLPWKIHLTLIVLGCFKFNLISELVWVVSWSFFF